MKAMHIIDADGRIANTINVNDPADFPELHLEDATVGQIGDLWNDGAPTPPVPDLVALRAAKNEEINGWRLEANLSTFPHAGKLIACDTLSRSDIDGVANSIALTGAFPANFPGGWKATDNTYVAMPTIDDFKAMYASMTAQGSANFNHAQSLKAAKDSATTAEEVAAIVW